MALPVAGTMHLTQTAPLTYAFDTTARNNLNGLVFQYRGVLQQQGAIWMMTTFQTNDPTIAPGSSMANQIGYDGTMLTFQSAAGVTAVWRRQ